MPNTLSIRSYGRQKVSHTHAFNQLVLPLRGVINIEVNSYKGKVTPGECVVIKATNVHSFTADTKARFVVADLDTLPDNIIHSDSVVFSISKPLLLFLAFIEGQLEFHVNKNLERLCYQTFYSLLSEQKLFTQLERRIREAIEYIEANITQQLPISQLAQVAYLSETQFKKLFKLQVGTTVAKYIVNLRMDKAKALLLHTDYPIHIVAEQVGYTDYTAFSRRFSAHFAMPPSKFMS